MLATGYYQLQLAANPSIVDGVATYLGYADGGTVPAAVVPVTGQALRQLEKEGVRAHHVIKIFISKEWGDVLQLGNQQGREPDRIVVRGVPFELFKREDWTESGNFLVFHASDADVRGENARGYGAVVLANVTSVGTGT